jgi:hypothetical protein
MDLRVMEASDLDGAVRVWQAANIARGKHPRPERVARVVEKLQEPTAVPYVAAGTAGITGMALLEPCRADDGAGAVVPDVLHVSMVFIDSVSQRQGTLGNPDTWEAATASGHPAKLKTSEHFHPGRQQADQLLGNLAQQSRV